MKAFRKWLNLLVVLVASMVAWAWLVGCSTAPDPVDQTQLEVDGQVDAREVVAGLADQLGRIDDELGDELESPGDSSIVPAGGNPSFGADKPLVRLVVFVDEEGLAEPAHYGMIRALGEELGDYVEFVVVPVAGTKRAGARRVGELSELRSDVLPRALLAADRQNEFRQIADLAHRRVGELDVSDDERRQLLVEWAGESGLDVERFEEDLDDESLIDEVQRNTATAAGLEAPTSGGFANGVRVEVDEADDLEPGEVELGETAAEEPAFGQWLAGIADGTDALLEVLVADGDFDRWYPEVVKRSVFVEAADRQLDPLEEVHPGIDPREPMWVAWIPVGQADAVTGETEDFVVTVTEWCLLRHHRCAEGYYIDELRERFGDRVRFVFQPFPPLERVEAAGVLERALVAAGQMGAFDQMRSAIADFVDEEQIEPTPEQLAERAGIDADELRRRIDQSETRDVLERGRRSLDWGLGPRTPAGEMTPLDQFGVMVNGIFARGEYRENGVSKSDWPPGEFVASLIEDQIELAEHLRERTGKTGDELYELVVELNADDPPLERSFEFRPDYDVEELDVDELPVFGPVDGVDVIAIHDVDDRGPVSTTTARAYDALRRAAEIAGVDVRYHWHYADESEGDGAMVAAAVVETYEQLNAQGESEAAGVSRGPVPNESFARFYEHLSDYFFVRDTASVLEWAAGDVDVELSREEYEVHDQRLQRFDERRLDADIDAAPVFLIGDEVVVGAAPVDEFVEALQGADK